MSSRKNIDSIIPVIDLFAGPGGLGEGFSAAKNATGDHAFEICLSVEKDAFAHQTLELRCFLRQFNEDEIPETYFEYLRGEISRQELLASHPREAAKARDRSWLAELGKIDNIIIRKRIKRALGGNRSWVLIGGPPCQAYSIAGRSRNKGIANYRPEMDHRHNLYQEYLKIIADFWPAVFVMENVKGLLSSKVSEEMIFKRILSDLSSPLEALSAPYKRLWNRHKYSLYGIGAGRPHLPGLGDDPKDFLVKCEDYGIPQARHRIIIIGVREDFAKGVHLEGLEPSQHPKVVKDVLSGLPRIRSGLSDQVDTYSNWNEAIRSSLGTLWFSNMKQNAQEVHKSLIATINGLNQSVLDRGAEFVPCKAELDFERDWFLDSRLRGVPNHYTRTHMSSDLHRYLFAACFAQANGKSPTLKDFPEQLLPTHKNVQLALSGSNFADRFRVQISDRPSTTITSHISKDGHFYIHYDPTQCRSLTVREAARLQTFPDNYFFEGPRTQQYSQVGNAVPPLLAKKIAEEIVLAAIEQIQKT